MTDHQELEQVMKRAHRYWYDDGLAEIAAGALLLLGGLTVFLLVVLLESSIAAQSQTAFPLILAVGLIVLTALGATFIGRTILKTLEAVKSRVTYPRTGYVAYRTPQVKQRPLLVRLGMVALMFVGTYILSSLITSFIVALQPPEWLMSMPVVEGAMVAILLLTMGRRMDLPRFYWLSALSALLGLTLANVDVGARGAALYFAGMGLILVVSGLIVLRGYLRDTEPIQEEGEI